MANGDTEVFYAEDVDINGVPSGGFEVFLGTWGTGGTLARTQIYASSNAGAAVSWAAGTRRIGLAWSAIDGNSSLSMGRMALFGDGSDGTVTVSSGTTQLVRDMFYDNLTISGTGAIKTNGFRVFVRNTLDISAAPAGAINFDGNNGALTASGTAIGGTTTGGSAAGGAGGNSTATTGAAGTQAAALALGLGPGGGAGGVGGTGGGGAGGAGGAAGVVTTTAVFPRNLSEYISRFATLILGGVAGSGGGGGGGTGSTNGGNGGGPGAGGGVIDLRARVINRSGTTAAGAIRANGGAGANGVAAGAVSNGGGGGGGFGGNGGLVRVIFEQLTGSVATGAVAADGGKTGDGGNGFGTGGGGNVAARPGASVGSVYLFNISAQTVTAATTATTAAGAGTAASGVTGGLGGAGAQLRVNL